MPRSQDVALPTPSTWVQLTNADVTNITFMNSGLVPVRIMATAGTTAPTTLSGSLTYNTGQGEANAALSELFSGVAGANRVWALAEQKTAVAVSHA